MSVNRVLDRAAELGVTMTGNDGVLTLQGPQSAIKEIAALAKPNKQELLQIIAGLTVDDVGHCDDCGSGLWGLPTFDKYINRTCPNCGAWYRCLPPQTACKRSEPICTDQPQPIQQTWLPGAQTPDSLLPNFQGVE